MGREIRGLENAQSTDLKGFQVVFLAPVPHPSLNSCSLPFECGVPPTRERVLKGKSHHGVSGAGDEEDNAALI